MGLSSWDVSPPKILLLIRDSKANTWEELCTAFGLDPNEFHTGHSGVWDELEGLRDAGLVEFRKIEGGETGASYRRPYPSHRDVGTHPASAWD